MIRNSFAFSVLLGQSIQLTNIRHNRPKPGLAQQHLIVTSLIQRLSNGGLIGADLLSTNVAFSPSQVLSTESSIDCDVGTAGAVSLVVQAALPCLLINSSTRASQQLNLTGGTNVPFSPPLDHLQFVLFPILAHMGLHCSIQIQRRGFYPVGGGKAKVIVESSDSVKPITVVTQGRPVAVHGVYYGTGTHFTQDMIDAFVTITRVQVYNFLVTRGLNNVVESLTSQPLFEESFNGIPKDYDKVYRESGKKPRAQHSTFGAQIWLSMDSGVPISANVIFEGKKADYFSPQLAARQLVAQLAWVLDSGACLDEHTADQLIIYMALAASHPVESSGEAKCAGVSEILCAPRCDPPALAGGEGESGHVQDPDSPQALLHPSSLHIESAIHIAKLFTGCEISLEEDPVTKCRKITVSPPAWTC